MQVCNIYMTKTQTSLSSGDCMLKAVLNY